MSDPTPFRGRIPRVAVPMRTLYRFKKPGPWAEIRERTIAALGSVEYIVFVDGSLLESELFHHGREAQYPEALAARVKQFTDGGWQRIDSSGTN